MTQLTPQMRLFCGVSTTLDNAFSSLSKLNITHHEKYVSKPKKKKTLKTDGRSTKGRKTKFDYDKLTPKVMELHRANESYKSIAEKIGITHFAVVKMVRFGIENNI